MVFIGRAYYENRLEDLLYMLYTYLHYVSFSILYALIIHTVKKVSDWGYVCMMLLVAGCYDTLLSFQGVHEEISISLTKLSCVNIFLFWSSV